MTKMGVSMLSVSTVVFDGHDLEAGFALLSALGIMAVEPAFIKGYMPFDETTFSPSAGRVMAQALARHGLVASALSAHIDLG